VRERGALFVYFERNYKFFGKRRIKVLLTGQKVSAFIAGRNLSIKKQDFAVKSGNNILSDEYAEGMIFMTAEEFKSAAKKLGITEVAANQTVELHEKFLRMGMTPASYEEILAAKQKKSCVEVFEAALATH
jgi:hypothetical protein